MNVVVVAPHPDDEIIGVGGTIAKYAMNGDDVYVIVVTKGVEPYYSAEYVEEGYQFIEKHLDGGYQYLADMNIAIIKEAVERFGFDTRLVIASKDCPTSMKNNERNVFQCLFWGCDTYYSGVGGKAYNDEVMYNANGIKIVYSDFQPVEYKQIGRTFVPNLSVLDYVMNNGFSVPNGWEKT